MLQLLSLCLVTVIEVTFAQSTVDVTQENNDVCSISGRTDHVLLVLSQLASGMTQLQTVMSQLQTDVTELKARYGKMVNQIV